MTIERFKSASFDKKCDWIIENTNFLMSVQTKEGKQFLYHSGDFFIEVYYSNHKQRVTNIQGFSDSNQLTHYLVNISLEELIN